MAPRGLVGMVCLAVGLAATVSGRTCQAGCGDYVFVRNASGQLVRASSLMKDHNGNPQAAQTPVSPMVGMMGAGEQRTVSAADNTSDWSTTKALVRANEKGRKDCISLRPKGLSRGDWRSFEPLIAAMADAALSPTPETIVATRLVRLSA